MRRDIYLYNLGTRISVNKPLIKVPDSWTTRYRLNSLPQLIFKKPNLEYIEDAGWHFNNLLSPHEILNKINWSSHQELNSENIADLKHILNSIVDRREVYRGTSFIVENDFESLPRIVRENPKEFKNLIAI